MTQHYYPHLLGVSDHVASAIVDRLFADVVKKDSVADRLARYALVGSMRNPKSQERSHRRMVASLRPMVVEHMLTTGRDFQSTIINITEAKGWVFSEHHRAIGIRIDLVGKKEGSGRHKLTSGVVKSAVIERHVLLRMIQRAGLTSYEALLEVIKTWSHMLISDNAESIAIAEYLHEERKRVLLPLLLHGRTAAILTGAESPGVGISHPVLRAITLFSSDMLTADECAAMERLSDKPATRFELIKLYPEKEHRDYE